MLLYTTNVESDEPIMHIDRHIGQDEKEGAGILGDVFAKELLFLDTLGKKRICVWINSPGGIVMDGMSIYNAILNSKTKVDTYNVGIAASIAGVIFQAGRTRYVNDYSLLMYHNPYGGDDKELEKMTESIAKMVATRSGKTEDEILKMMKKTSWINADEALESGLCDVINKSDEVNRPRIRATQAKAAWAEADKILNKLKTKNTMSKVANSLGLNAEASEDAMLDAINKIKNEATEDKAQAKKKAEEMEEEMKNLKKKMDDDAANFKKMEDDYKNMKAKADADEADAKKNKAENLIKEHVKSGRLKNEKEVINLWTEKAIENFDATKSLIESIPLSKKATVVVVEDSAKAELGSVIARTMADKRIAAKI